MDLNDSFFDDSLLLNVSQQKEDIKFLMSHRSIETAEITTERLQNVQKVVKYLPKLSVEEKETEILQILMPTLKEYLESVLEKNLLLSTKIATGSSLENVRDNFKNCIIVFEILNVILDDFLQNGPLDFLYIHTVSLNVAGIIAATFDHCKSSNEYYQEYFQAISEILELFRNSQNVHTKLLKLLEYKVKCESLNSSQSVKFGRVLDLLCKVSDVLSGVNMKSLIENWKCFVALTQKYVNVLGEINYSVLTALECINFEVNLYLDNVLTSEKSDTKNILQNVKVTNLLLKIALKLCEIFEANLQDYTEIVLTIIISVHKIALSYLRYKGYSSEVITVAQSLFHCTDDQLLEKLSTKVQLYKVLSTKDILDHIVGENHFPFLLTANKIVQLLLRDESKMLRNEFEFPVYLDYLFLCVKDCFVELLWNLKASEDDGRSFYEELLINTAACVVAHAFCYESVETIFLRNVLEENDWCSLFAIDCWCLSLMNANSRARYNVLCNIVDKTQMITGTHFLKRPEFVHLNFLIRMLHEILDVEEKEKFMQKYPFESNLHVWKIIGLKKFPVSHRYLVENLIIAAFESLDLFQGNSSSLAAFKDLLALMEVLATIDYKLFGIKTKRFASSVARMWEFDVNNTSLLTSNLFKTFMEKLIKCSNCLLLWFSNSELLLILTQIKKLLTISSIKLPATQILLTLTKKTIDNSPEKNQLLSTISAMFNLLLRDSNPIITQVVLEIFVEFTNVTPHEVVIDDAIGSSKELQELVSKFIKNEFSSKDAGDSEEYFKYLASCNFKHACVEWSSIDMPQQKRFKSTGSQVSLHLEQIKEHVRKLSAVCTKGDLSDEHVEEINDIINQLQAL